MSPTPLLIDDAYLDVRNWALVFSDGRIVELRLTSFAQITYVQKINGGPSLLDLLSQFFDTRG
jgi:hypothetical protein